MRGTECGLSTIFESSKYFPFFKGCVLGAPCAKWHEFVGGNECQKLYS